MDGCSAAPKGRSTDTWVDFDFFGHQLSLHLGEPFATARTGHVGHVPVPMPHLGLVLELPDWQAMADRLQAAGTAFVLEPQVRFEGQPGEQWTMFFMDPFGNPIEMKGFPQPRRSVQDRLSRFSVGEMGRTACVERCALQTSCYNRRLRHECRRGGRVVECT